MDRIFDLDYIESKIYYLDNIDAHRKNVRERNKVRRKTDPMFQFMTNMRSRLNIAFKKRDWKKDSKTCELLGCAVEDGMRHIESKFRKGMTWENYGEWHIDHIIPLCSATTIEEIEQLCHFSNLQPLWAKDNISKRGKIQNRI